MRNKIILESLSWNQTPYHHHARVKGVGVDCAQLIVGTAIGAGVITEEEALKVPSYPIQWHLHNREEKLLEVLESFGCVEVPIENATPGDILTFKFGRVSSHLGILLNHKIQMIHARYDIGKVVINTIQADWADRWTRTYRFPGVE